VVVGCAVICCVRGGETVWSVGSAKTERLQDGAAQGAFESAVQQSSGGNESQGGSVCRLVASMLEHSARSARYGPHGFAMSERGKDGMPWPLSLKCGPLYGGKSGAYVPFVASLLEEISAPPETPPLRSRHSRVDPSQRVLSEHVGMIALDAVLCRAWRCCEGLKLG
jgi:hypothetical protein